MTCTDLRDLLSAYADGEVSPAQREWLDLHLERCPTCQGRLSDYRRVRSLLAALPADTWVPPALPAPRSIVRPRMRRVSIARSWSVVLALVLGLVAGTAGTASLRGGRALMARAVSPRATRESSAPRGPSSAIMRGSVPGVGERMARAVAAEALPATRSLPDDERGAIVVLVYLGGSHKPTADRRLDIYQVDDPVATWSALQQALRGQAAQRLPTTPPRQATWLARQRSRLIRLWAVRVV